MKWKNRCSITKLKKCICGISNNRKHIKFECRKNMQNAENIESIDGFLMALIICWGEGRRLGRDWSHSIIFNLKELNGDPAKFHSFDVLKFPSKVFNFHHWNQQIVESFSQFSSATSFLPPKADSPSQLSPPHPIYPAQ